MYRSIPPISSTSPNSLSGASGAIMSICRMNTCCGATASNSCSNSRRLPHTPTMKPLFRSSNAISRPKPEVAPITIALRLSSAVVRQQLPILRLPLSIAWLRLRLPFRLSIVLATNYLTSVRRPVSEFMMKPLTVMSLGIRG